MKRSRFDEVENPGSNLRTEILTESSRLDGVCFFEVETCHGPVDGRVSDYQKRYIMQETLYYL